MELLIIGSSLVGAASATARKEARKRATGANSIVDESKEKRKKRAAWLGDR